MHSSFSIIVLLLIVATPVTWLSHQVSNASAHGDLRRIRTVRRWYYLYWLLVMSIAQLAGLLWPTIYGAMGAFLWPLILGSLALTINPDIIVKSDDILARRREKQRASHAADVGQNKRGED